MGSWASLSACRHVATYGDGEAHGFDGDTAHDKGGSRRGIREKNHGSDGQEKSSWHDQQTGIFHDPYPPVRLSQERTRTP